MYRLESLDVWGNDIDGYEINNWFHETDIDLPKYSKPEEIIKYLKENNWLKKEAEVYGEDMGSENPLIRIYLVKENFPVYDILWEK